MQKLYSLNKKKHNILFCSEYITQPKYNEVWTSYTLFILTYFWLLVKKYHQKNSLITYAAIIVYTKKYTICIFFHLAYIYGLPNPNIMNFKPFCTWEVKKQCHSKLLFFSYKYIFFFFRSFCNAILSIKIRQTNNIMLYH